MTTQCETERRRESLGNFNRSTRARTFSESPSPIGLRTDERLTVSSEWLLLILLRHTSSSEKCTKMFSGLTNQMNSLMSHVKGGSTDQEAVPADGEALQGATSSEGETGGAAAAAVTDAAADSFPAGTGVEGEEGGDKKQRYVRLSKLRLIRGGTEWEGVERKESGTSARHAVIELNLQPHRLLRWVLYSSPPSLSF